LLAATMVMLFGRAEAGDVGRSAPGIHGEHLARAHDRVRAQGLGGGRTTRRTLGLAADIVLGLPFVLIPFVIGGDRDGGIPLALAGDSLLAGITRISQAARRTPARPSSA
jgi:hypothetical protein